MKTGLVSALTLFLLTGCQALARTGPAPALAALEPGCQSPGVVRSLTLDQTSRGTSYTYGLYLPPCYESRAEGSFPVVYLVPGRGSGPGAWFAAGAAQVADDLILSGEVPPFLIVTSENIDGDPDAEVILEDLIPYIESNYPVSPDHRHRAVAGGSLGGIAAYRIGFRYPDRFATVGIFGSGAISGEEARIRAWLAEAEKQPRVFLNTGFEDPLMLERARVMLALLDESGTAHTHIFSRGGHNYDYWVLNLPAYVHWLALDW